MPGRAEACPTAVALVASAGGLVAISEVLEGLPDDLDAALIVLMHLLPEHPSMLPELLSRKTGLHVKVAEDGDAMEPGHVYVGPPDFHVVVAEHGRLRLDSGPRVHHVRPAADVLLDSLARICDVNSMAVVLTGTGTDGADGARAVKLAGGRVLVQDPDSSEHGGMPQAAIAAGAADSVISLGEIAPAIVAYVAEMNSN